MNLFSKKTPTMCWLFVAFFALLSSPYINAQSCPPAQTGCTPEATFTTTVVPQGYPTCTLTVTYKLRVCQGEFQIYGISVSQLGMGCNQYLTDVIALFLANPIDVNEQGAFIRRFFRSTYAQIGDQLFNIAVAGGPADLYLCDNPNSKLFTATFYNGSCSSICVGLNNSTGSIVITPVNCGNTCCKYERTYCIDPITGLTKVVETTTEATPGNCFSLPAPACGAETGVTPLFQGPCLPVCSSN